MNILTTLVDKLSPECSEEDNLNASSILQDALDTKEFYSVISRKNTLTKLLDYALPSSDVAVTTSVDSQNAALGVLSALV